MSLKKWLYCIALWTTKYTFKVVILIFVRDFHAVEATTGRAPYVYDSINDLSVNGAINNWIFNPGDIVKFTCINSFYSIPGKPLCPSGVKEKQIAYFSFQTGFDPRYFDCVQESIEGSASADGTKVNYTRRFSCKLRKINYKTHLAIISGSTSTSPFQKNQLTEDNWIPMPLDGSTSMYKNDIPEKTYLETRIKNKIPGTIYSFEHLNNVVLYPGDAIQFKLLSCQYLQTSEGVAIQAFDHVLMPYGDVFDVLYGDYFVSNASNSTSSGDVHVPATGENVIQDVYYIVKLEAGEIIQKRMNSSSASGSESFDVAVLRINSDIDEATATANFKDTGSVKIAILPTAFDFVDLNSPLYKKLRFYISTKAGCRANSQDEDKRTPLMWSIIYGNTPAAQAFLQDPLLVLAMSDVDGRTALTYAVEKDNQELVTQMVSLPGAAEALVTQDKEGMTPLHYAVWNNNYVVTQALLSVKEQTSLVNIKNKYGVTPLLYAAAQGNKRIAQLLLHAGANPSIVDNNGFNVLFYAAMSLSTDFFSFLYQYLNEKYAAQLPSLLQGTAVDGSNIIYNVLLGQKGDGVYDMIKLLLSCGVPVEQKYNAEGIVKMQPYLRSPAFGRGIYQSSLEVACSRGVAASEVIQVLMSNYAYIDKNVLAIAKKNGVDTLVKNYITMAGPMLYQALYNSDTSAAQSLIEQFDPALPMVSSIANYTNQGWSLLFLLSVQAQGKTMAAYVPIAQALIARGANINAMGPDAQGNPVLPLSWAITNGNTALQSLLEQSGSAVSQTIANTLAPLTANTSQTSSGKPNSLYAGTMGTQMATNAANFIMGPLYCTRDQLLG